MKKLVLLAVLIVCFVLGNAQSTDLAEYKSLFTLNFVRYIGWPEGSKQGDFVIGVLKSSRMADYLREKTAGKNFGFQKFVIKEFKTVDEVSNCQILYVSEYVNFAKHSAVFLQKLHNNGSLIITENEDAIDHGSMINFVVVDNKLKFEVSQANAEKFALKLSSSLLAMNNAIKK